MKDRLCLIALFTSITLTVQAQGFEPTAVSAAPLNTNYAVIERGPHHRVLEAVEYETGPGGQQVAYAHRYTELATGMHYQKDGQWVESKEEIDILPNGAGAAATNGQHKVIFPPNINGGVIELNTPDGKWLNTRLLGLAYFDTASGKSVMIAEVKDSVGQLQPPNVVIYPDAFTDFKADVRYTYRRAGLEQDVILWERPLLPETYGLSSQTTWLQVWTEFLNPPQPAVQTVAVPTATGGLIQDQLLGFGTMQVGQGGALTVEVAAPQEIPMVKEWLDVQGRYVLVEEVSVPAVAGQLDQLPMPPQPAVSAVKGSVRHVVSTRRLLPEPKLVKAATNTMRLAKVAVPTRGLVLDYVTLISGQTNYTFRGDTTYYISGFNALYGTNTFEGGAVLKYATNGTIQISPGPPGYNTPVINLVGAGYRPVVFTAQDDDSVGETLTNSTHNPSGPYYANPALYLACLGGNPMANFRIAYAKQAVTVAAGGSLTGIQHGQIFNCQYGINLGAATILLGNMLFANVGTNFNFGGASSISAQNVTFSQITRLATQPSPSDSIYFTNCVFANVTSLTNSANGVNLTGQTNGFYNSPPFGTGQVTNTFYPFQTVGAGNYYLTNGCNFFNQGTTNIASALLADLRKKTTYPPIVYSNVTISVGTVLGPQAQRDTDIPDLGYHYDPIDYIADAFAITNATLTITNGAAIASYNETGVWLQDGSSIVSIGSPVHPNWFVRYSSVQEQPVSLGMNGLPPCRGMDVYPYHYGSVAANGQYRFTKFACPAGGGCHLYDQSSSWAYGNLLVQDCEFWSGADGSGKANYFGGAPVATLRNNLFNRSTILAQGGVSASLSLSNNLVWGVSSVSLLPGTNVWYAYNNAFDTCTITGGKGGATLTNGFNAYINCSGRLNPTNANDIVLTNFTYAIGPLGNYYQFSTNLLNMGSTTADQAGLYHYTVQTNLVYNTSLGEYCEIKETTNTVSIGYHYVAVDANGNPIDTNGNGVPDYLEDANGNGLVDSGETDWRSATDLGLKVLITMPKNNSVIP